MYHSRKVIGFLFLLLSACSQNQQIETGLEPSSDQNPSLSEAQHLPLYDAKATICDPFDPINESAYGNLTKHFGLKGRVYYLSDDMARFTSVEQISSAKDVNMDLFLKDINVPTRMFDRGFPVANGSLLQVDNTVLNEWFGILANSHIQLAENDEEGLYQLALIADDGATLEGVLDGQLEMLVDNDGTHSSRLACATQTISMLQETRIPIHLKYYQGPKTEIALMLMWRKVTSPTDLSESLCGATGQNKFFEYRNNPSTPQPAYNDLLSRGWKPLVPENFVVDEGDVNPCLSSENWL